MNVVYTAITGKKDWLKDEQWNPKSSEFVAFLDDPTIKSTVWRIEKANDTFKDPNRNAKIHKVLAHRYFPEAEYSLWIDGSVVFTDELDVMAELYLKSADIATFKHMERDCIYDEAEVCIRLNLDDRELIQTQIDAIRREGYPQHAGLSECTIILRRHTPKVAEFNEMWWDMIVNGSRRDQLAFNYCLWKLGIKLNYFVNDIYHTTHFKYHGHLKNSVWEGESNK